MNTVIATGLDGKPSIWPVNAVSRDKAGVFRDIKGRVVGGVAMDAAPKGSDAVQGKIQRAKRIVARNAEDDAAIRKLFPSLVAATNDDAEREQEAFDEPEAEDNEAETIAAYNDAVKAERERWDKISKDARQRSQFAGSTGRYAPANNRAAKAADGKSIALNARRAKGYSLFNSATRITKLSNQRASL